MAALEQAEKWFLERKLTDSDVVRSYDVASGALTDRLRHVIRPATQYASIPRIGKRPCPNCDRPLPKTSNSRSRPKFTDQLPVIVSEERRQKREANRLRTSDVCRKLPYFHGSQPLLGGGRHVKPGTRQRSRKALLHPATFSLPVGMDSVGTSAGAVDVPDPSDHGRQGSVGRRTAVLPTVDRHKSAENPLGSDKSDTDWQDSQDSESSDLDSLKSFRRSATEREAQKEVEHNWILRDRLTDMNKHFERRKKHLAITLADEDAMAFIDKRLEEIRLMAEGKGTKKSVLDKYKPEVREMILKYKDIPVHQIKKARRKKGIKSIDRYREAVTLVMVLLRGFRGRTRYFTEQADSTQQKSTSVSTQRGLMTGRSSISYDLRLALTTQPHLRDGKALKQIIWVLRATKAFKHLFPAEMEDELARNVAYERYDDSRVIACQGRSPDRFYYIISGRVNLMRQYKLSSGHVTKAMGFLTKGMTTDPKEIDKQWMREDNLVTKGQVEVLLLDKKSFRLLQHTTDGPPVEYLQSLHLFQEFPMDAFINNHDSVEVSYYGPGKIVVKDSNRTPWLHVVKSGLVKVVRRQSVIDARLSNESKFSAPTVERLGCGKPFSHADAMLGIQAKQRKLKAFRDGLILPQIGATTYDISANPLGSTLGISAPVIYRQQSASSPAKQTDIEDGQYDDEEEEEEGDEEEEASKSSDNALSEHPKLLPSPAKSQQQPSPGQSSVDVADFEPHELWLTREKTGNEVIFPRIRKKEEYRRRAYLQLDVLQPGDVFGLDHLQPAIASEPVGFSLLSDGAEVVKISKRFFLQNADNNTMLKVETMYKEYLSEKEAEKALYQQETWEQYKAALWSRMTANRLPLAAHDR